jgi:hypothetical protein
MTNVYRILKPGGEFIMTVDLYLDIAPFTERLANDYGSNIDLHWLSNLAPFELVFGNPMELYGFPEFDRDGVLCNLEQFLCGTYPVLVQCLILRKPEAPL